MMARIEMAMATSIRVNPDCFDGAGVPGPLETAGGRLAGGHVQATSNAGAAIPPERQDGKAAGPRRKADRARAEGADRRIGAPESDLTLQRHHPDSLAPVTGAVVVGVEMELDLVGGRVEGHDYVVLPRDRLPLGALETGAESEHRAFHLGAKRVDGGHREAEKDPDDHDADKHLDEAEPATGHVGGSPQGPALSVPGPCGHAQEKRKLHAPLLQAWNPLGHQRLGSEVLRRFYGVSTSRTRVRQ
jgi:hypothetical protein